ncbi:MAG: UvrD-helicase domain-containing protein [Pseudomonadota bacterium]
MSAPRRYRIDAPLQPGTTLLEASAGTGKTYQITNLVLRLLTEPEDPIRMGQLLVVTFTRAATGELVDRVRARLAEALRVYRLCARAPALEPALDEAAADPSLRALARRAWSQGALPEHVRRLERAQEEFDQALISTIHGFCQRMLLQNAFESMVDFGLELVEDDRDLLEEIVDDFISARINAVERARHDFLVDTCGFSRAGLVGLASRALHDPRMPVDPDPAAAPPGRAVRLAGFAVWWESVGLPELCQAMEVARLSGAIVPKAGAKSQSKYTGKACLERGVALLAWVRALLAGDGPGDCPEAAAWSAEALAEYAPGPEPWHHPHLDRVRAMLAPDAPDVDHERARFIRHVREEFARRNLARRSMCFQDLLRLLAERLEAEGPAGPLRGAVAARFRAALIDEFQDTDPEQWSIFSALFAGGPCDGGHHLYLIGDPKQAIYGFRGANVHVYLAARASAGERVFSMGTNYRSDAAYLRALAPLMAAPLPAGATPDPAQAAEGMFSLAGIAYEPVEADEAREPAVRLRAAPGGPVPAPATMAPLQLRFLAGGAASGSQGPAPQLRAGQAQRLLARQVAADIVALLEQGLQIHEGRPGAWRPLSPGHMAVLVRKGRQARMVQEALLQAGVPCVLPGAESVLSTEEARHLQRWLEAVASPGSDRAARAAATTPLFGVQAALLLALDDPAAPPEASAWWDRWLADLAAWQAQIQQHGVLRAFRAAMQGWGVQARLLAFPDGERRLTNLTHLLELLHTAQVHDHLQLAGLIRWLSAQRREGSAGSESGELRLERDDAAVRILTMHKAKGLQFPVVFAPFLWGATRLHRADRDALIVPAEGDPTRRLLDVHVAQDAEPKLSRLRIAEREQRQEELRLLYVALTRAELRCVVYTGHLEGLAASPLGALLHAFSPGTPPGQVGDRIQATSERLPTLGAAELWADLEALVRAGGREPDGTPRLALERCAPPAALPSWQPAGAGDAALAPRVFTRRDALGQPHGMDLTWRRESYTSLARSRGRPATAPSPGATEGLSEAQAQGKDHDQADGGAPEGPSPAEAERLRAALPRGPEAEAEVPLAAFPAGAAAGTFLHAVFEQLDFSPFAWAEGDAEGQAAAQAELRRVLADLSPLHGFEAPRWQALLEASLPGVLRAPLGGPLGGLRLADLPRTRRLDELAFDLPIAGGDEHRRPAADGSVCFEERVSGMAFGEAFSLGPPDPLLRPSYLRQLAAGWQRQRFAGYLTGSIDLVFAVPGGPGGLRFFVVDYKSNRLDLLGERSTPRAHFCPAWLLHEMEQHDYIVQYHLYTLALHRFLTQRLRGYDYDLHVGGAAYLFVRGMGGTAPEGAPPWGVFHHRPARAVIQRLDALFEGEGGRS